MKRELTGSEWAEVRKAYTEHLKWYFGEPAKSQRSRSRYAFAMALLVFLFSGAGIVLTYLQLSWAHQLRSPASPQTDLSLSATQVSLQTSVVGLVPMLMVVVLIWLYYKYVYAPSSQPPIQLPWPSPAPEAAFSEAIETAGGAPGAAPAPPAQDT